MGLAQFRLGRYAEALATLQNADLPKLSLVSGTLMSPWILPSILSQKFSSLDFDPIDLTVRAMCHHHLKQPHLAATCLRQARQKVKKKGSDTAERRALLLEAETLIEGKGRP